MATWNDRIVMNSAVLTGKPVIRGTRISVEFIVDLLAQGVSEPDILKNYPGVAIEDIGPVLRTPPKFSTPKKSIRSQLEPCGSLPMRMHPKRLYLPSAPMVMT